METDHVRGVALLGIDPGNITHILNNFLRKLRDRELVSPDNIFVGDIRMKNESIRYLVTVRLLVSQANIAELDKLLIEEGLEDEEE